jgi:hypothetical protein
MTLGQLVEMHNSGALNIKFEKEDTVANLAGIQITQEQALVMVRNLGWEDIYLSPFEIIDKTNKFARGIKTGISADGSLKDTIVTFRNTRSNVYGKTFDRIHLLNPRYFEVSVIYGMPGNSSPYVIYDSKTSIPLQRCRNLKKVTEYLNNMAS